MKLTYLYPNCYHCEYRILYRDPLGLPMFVYTTEYYIRKAIRFGRISPNYRLVPFFNGQIFEFVSSSYYNLSRIQPF